MTKRLPVALALLLIGHVVVISQERKAVEPKESSDLVARSRTFIDLLAGGDFQRAEGYFDDAMKAALSQDKLQAAWNTITSQAGAFKRQARARTEKRGSYDAVIITCEFERAAIDVQIVFDSAKRIAGLFFTPTKEAAEYVPPSYVKPNAFREKEVTVGTGEWALPATLTLPAGQGPFPAVVLVHGSGPHDRDETVGQNKPFRDLAWGLASRGIAVLRYEKRTKQYADRLKTVGGHFTVKEETIDDALAAVALLRRTEGIDAKRIFVLGHSLGGTLIPRIGQLDPNIAGFIVLAGATRPMEDSLVEQMTYIFSLDGKISREEEAQLEEIKRQVAKIKSLKPSEAHSAASILGAPVSYWLDLRGYDPAEAAKSLKQPMLILQGERDYQVTADDFRRWKAALSAKPNVEFKSYPKLNHLFIEGSGKSSPAEYNTPGHVAEAVINDIADWIRKTSTAQR